MKKIFFLPLFFFTTILHAQYAIKYWDKFYGGTDYEQSPVIKLSQTGDIYICSWSISGVSGNKTQPLCYNFWAGISPDLWMLKIDKYGNILWQYDYGGPFGEGFPDFILTSSNKILVVSEANGGPGCTKSVQSFGGTNTNNYWILMLDTNGNKLWDKNFGSMLGDVTPKVVELTNGEFIVCGIGDYTISGDKTMANWSQAGAFWAVKFDSLGNKIWDHVYGGIAGAWGPHIVASDHGSFVVAGTIELAGGDISDTSRGGEDYWVIKIDSSGNKIWDKRFGGNHNDQLGDICKSNDNGYMLCGATVSAQGLDVSQPKLNNGPGAWVIKLDSVGNKIWDKRFQGGNLLNPSGPIFQNGFGYGTCAQAIQPDPEGGYGVLITCSDSMGNDFTEPGIGDDDYLMLRIDEAGNKIWDKRFGNALQDVPSSFVYLQDSSIIVCGASQCRGIDIDIWALRFKMTDHPLGVSDLVENLDDLFIYPNPTSESVHFTCNIHKPGEINVFNSQGELVLRKVVARLDENETIDLSSFPQGVYFIRCCSGDLQQTGSVTKL